MRRLVVCCDGTWNSPENSDNGQPAPTNVRKFWANVAEQGADGIEQIRFYRTGVGTLGGVITRLLGGAIGFKLEDDIKSAYKFLAETYQPEDEIYLLGFSRGAYTARSLAGMIASVGLADLTPVDMSDDTRWQIVHERLLTYQNDKAKGEGWWLRQALARWPVCPAYRVRDGDDVPIRFLGVWDTVGALGIPDDYALMKRVLGDVRYNRFHDTELGTGVKTARHALAVDERRIDFTPTLWTDVATERDVKQIWFPGVHGDVGGSYADHGLGDATLSWMMEAAQQCGLTFRSGAYDELAPDPRAMRHDSYSGLFKRRRTRPRAVPSFLKGGDDDTFIGPDALARHAQPGKGEAEYWETQSLEPGDRATVRVHARERWGRTGIFVQAGEEYRITAQGTWLDAGIVADADGAWNSLQLGYTLALVPETIRGVLRWCFQSDQPDNSRSRRVDGPWFGLIAAVTSGKGVDGKSGERLSHQFTYVGAIRRLYIERDGYLYFFANDVWRNYDNNSGSLTVEITRDA